MPRPSFWCRPAIRALGHASLGSWVTYGLGTENQNLPGFIVLISNGGTTANAGKPLWGSGFLPSVYQGVQCRSAGEPVLYLRKSARRQPAGAPRGAGCGGRDQSPDLSRSSAIPKP